MRYQLPITPEYVKSWDLWSAVRELLQNAIDARTENSDCEVLYEHDGDTLQVGNTGSELQIETLLLGKSSKRDSDGFIGNFGEGYKLAALVLVRMGYEVTVRTGRNVWEFSLKESSDFPGNQVLTIEVTDSWNLSQDTVFYIKGVTVEDWETLRGKYLPEAKDDTKITGEAGKIYIKGLYVCQFENMDYSYNFRPGALRLERDRQLASEYDVAYITSSLRVNEEDEGDKLLTSLESDRLDTYYTSSFIRHAPIKKGLLDAYKTRYGDAIPVSTNEEAQEMLSKGVVYRIVPQRLKEVLTIIGNWIIPKSRTPQDLLKAWFHDNKMQLSVNAAKDFKRIIEVSANWYGPTKL